MPMLEWGVAVALIAGPVAPPRLELDNVARFLGPPVVDSLLRAPRASRAQNDPVDSLYNAAMHAVSSNHYREAIELFKQLATRYPKSKYIADGLYWRAFAFYRLGGDSDLREGLRLLRVQRGKFPKVFTSTDAAALRERILGELARRGDPTAVKLVTNQGKWVVTRDEPGNSATCDAVNTGMQSDDIKIAALNALVQMDPALALPTLEEVLHRRDKGSLCLRRSAILLLAQQQTEGVEAVLLDAVRSDPDLEVRKQAALYLSQFSTERVANALDSIVRTSTDAQLVERAVIALSQSDNPAAQQALRAYAERDDLSKATRHQVITWLLQRQSTENAEFLRRLYPRLGSDEVDLRRSIVQSLSQLGDSATARWLLEIARGNSVAIELRMQALAVGAQATTIEDLAKFYTPTLDHALRVQLVDTYARYADPAALDQLGEIAKHDPDPELRVKAISHIAQSQDPHAAEVLEAIVEHK